ncbi:MAG: sugar phosphate isomerase/epimerase [Lachnospiraceae bacterium]|nr:sugar phosphate isomerase/epimerase [Lachnospiraceae bacterium]
MKYFSKDRFCNFNLHYDSFYSLRYFFECMKKLDVKHCELIAGHQSLYMDHKEICDLSEVKQLSRDNGVKIDVITAQNCRFPYQYGAKEPELREMTYEFFANGIRMAAELGAHIVQCNTGWGYLNEPLEDCRKRCADLIRRLCEFADGYDVSLACESLRPQESLFGCRLDQIKELSDMVDHPRFGILIDTTAMGVAGETIQQWFDVFGKKIIHMHFIDANPYFHYLWGEGKRNLGEDLKVLYDNGYEGLISQELTLGAYYQHPYETDLKNLAAFSEYLY